MSSTKVPDHICFRGRGAIVAWRVKQDYAAVAGKVVLLKSVSGYLSNGDSTDRPLDPPLEFKVSTTVPAEDLNRVNDSWVDPIWDVVPVNPGDPQLAGIDSLYCYGTSYHVVDDLTEPGDVTVPQGLRTFKVPYTFSVSGEIKVNAKDAVDAQGQIVDMVAVDLLAHGSASAVNVGLVVEVR